MPKEALVEQTIQVDSPVEAVQKKRITEKKIGLAMSGGGSRAPIYFGIIDVLTENNIPIDMAAALSSATFIACTYASGTMEQLRKRSFELSARELFNMFEPSMKGGVFSFGKADSELDVMIPYDNIEELPIPIAIVAADIMSGENVVFRMGNIMRAIKASCSMPGLFEPIVWGNRVLVDGGLFSIVPTQATRDLGADFIIGIDLHRNETLYPDNMVRLKKGYNLAKKPFRTLSKWRRQAFSYIFGEKEDEVKHISNLDVPNILSIVGKTLDYAMLDRKRAEYFDCDIMLVPDNSRFGEIDMDNPEAMYEEGRRVTIEALPKIFEMLKKENKK